MRQYNATNLLGLSCTLADPFLRFVPGLVQSQKASLAPPLDELIRLGY